MRLIDADALMESAKGYSPIQGELCGYYDFAWLVNAEPTVDTMEVVRCKDCKWYKPGEMFDDIMFCWRLKKENGKPAKYNYCEDDFCSYGERKNE